MLVFSFWQRQKGETAFVSYIYFACSAAGNSSCFQFLASVDVGRHEESSCGYQEEIRRTPAHPCSIIHARGGPTACSMLGNRGCRSLAEAYGQFYVQGDTKKTGNLKNPTKIEEIQGKKFIDRNWTISNCILRDSNPDYQCLKIASCRWRPPPRMHSFTATTHFKSSRSFVSHCVCCMLCRMRLRRILQSMKHTIFVGFFKSPRFFVSHCITISRHKLFCHYNYFWQPKEWLGFSTTPNLINVPFMFTSCFWEQSRSYESDVTGMSTKFMYICYPFYTRFPHPPKKLVAAVCQAVAHTLASLHKLGWGLVWQGQERRMTNV